MDLAGFGGFWQCPKSPDVEKLTSCKVAEMKLWRADVVTGCVFPKALEIPCNHKNNLKDMGLSPNAGR